MLAHAARELLFVDLEPAVDGQLARQLDWEAVRRRERERVVSADRPLRGDLLEHLEPALECLREALLLGLDRVADQRAVLDELRVPRAHLLDDDLGHPPEVGQADRSRLLDGAPDDAAQHVAAALVRRHDAVADEERHPAAVVGEDPVRLGRGLGVAVRDAALLRRSSP